METKKIWVLLYYLPDQPDTYEMLGFYETEAEAREVKDIIYDKNDPNYVIEEWEDHMPF